MATSAELPGNVALVGVAGDTLTRLITVSDPQYAAGCTWTGHVALTREQATPDTTWTITPDAAGGATITLTADQTRQLIELVAPATGSKTRQYVGVYDIQIQRPDGWVRTLLQGTLTLSQDVTRTP